MAKHTLKILPCSHRKIFKVCLTILRNYAVKGLRNSNKFDTGKCSKNEDDFD